MVSLLQRLGIDITKHTAVTDQLPRVWSALIYCSLIAVVGVAGVYALGTLTGTSLSDLTRDPAAVVKYKVYIGILSNIGILFWTAAAAICFLGAAVIKKIDGQQQLGVFLFYSGCLTLLLGIDDLFLLHEYVIPNTLFIPQKVVVLSYLLAAAAYLIRFHKWILSTDYLLLALAFCFLGLSLFVDQVFPYSDFESYVEDSFKFAGIVFWLAYFAHVTISAITGSQPR